MDVGVTVTLKIVRVRIVLGWETIIMEMVIVRIRDIKVLDAVAIMTEIFIIFVIIIVTLTIFIMLNTIDMILMTIMIVGFRLW